MKLSEYGGFLLEGMEAASDDGMFHVWLSSPDRFIVGHAKAATLAEAISCCVADGESSLTAAATRGKVPLDIDRILVDCALNYLAVRPFCGSIR